jgi:peptidoglycan/xylan/chitin deacetylase (PgdA/CDA1 family)
MNILNEFNTIVLHRVVTGNAVDFIDISLKNLRFILEKSEYSFVSVEEAFENRAQDRQNICLTFDDGFLSDHDLVFPELKMMHANATFFLVTDFLNTPGYLTTNQVKILSESGMQIGSHSKSHPNFLKLTASERIKELRDSKVILEKIIGKEVTTFSFPFGFYNHECAQAVFLAGYSICCTSKHGISSKLSFMVSRNSINAQTSMSQINKILQANLLQQLSWYVEDIVKVILKRFFPKFYIGLRNLISAI